jgi:hypothetical protein
VSAQGIAFLVTTNNHVLEQKCHLAVVEFLMENIKITWICVVGPCRAKVYGFLLLYLGGKPPSRHRDNGLGINISTAHAGSRVGDSTEVQVVRLSQLSMSVRVVARIRPLLESENEIDAIVRTSGADESARPNVVKVPNPKNFSEEFSFQFNSVYGENATQQEIFDAEGELQGPSGTENDTDNVLQ